MRFTLLLAGASLALLAPPLVAQSTPAEVAEERAAYTAWLEGAPNSPRAAVAQQPIGTGLRLGPPDADIPLAGIAEQRVSERNGAIYLESAEGSRMLPRGQPARLGRYTIVPGGPVGRGIITVFGDSTSGKPAKHYPYDASLVFEGTLAPPERGRTVRVLAVDGIETEAAEAGTVTVPIGGARTNLRVRRIRTSEEESELEIYFRDGTNGNGTYPAGRFVSLIPLEGGRYRLDFNRARNPFCAYSTAYPCPAPWSGNAIEAPVRAGEQYVGGGLSTPPIDEAAR